MYNNLRLFTDSNVIFFWLLHKGGGLGFTQLGLIWGVGLVAFSPALTCLSQLGSGTSANEGTEGGAEGGGAGIYRGVYGV